MRIYGLVGLATIIFAEISLFLKIQPFNSLFCPTVWLGYILLIDSIVYGLKKDSLLTRHTKKVPPAFMISIIFWIIFEIYNRYLRFHDIGGWTYSKNIGLLGIIAGIIAFSTILPAILETAELIRSLHLFDRIKGPKMKFLIKKDFLRSSIVLGGLFLIFPFFNLSQIWTWTMIWTGFFFLLDSINYLNGQPSIFGQIRNGKWLIPLSLVFAGLVCGFLWEFWNWWAVYRWQYNLPNIPLASVKIFEMPILGYLGYIPFALELYAMYNFIRFLFRSK